MSDISKFIRENKTIRKIAQNPPDGGVRTELDLFEERDREKSLKIALESIRKEISTNGNSAGLASTFLMELLSFSAASLDGPAKKRRGRSQKATPATETPMEVEACKAVAKVDEPASSSSVQKDSGKSKKNDRRSKAPERAASTKGTSKAAPKQKKDRARLYRKLLPCDFPVSGSTELFKDERFTTDLVGKAAFTESRTADEVSNCRQGDLHSVAACRICDSFRLRVGYYTQHEGEVLQSNEWLPKLTPYQHRLCVLAHAYHLSFSTSFANYTEGYAWFDFGKYPVQPRLDDAIISLESGRKVSLPVKLGVKDSDLPGHNRQKLRDIRKDLLSDKSDVDWSRE